MRAQSVLTFTTALVAASIGAGAAQAQELTRAVQRVELHGDAPAACVANGTMWGLPFSLPARSRFIRSAGTVQTAASRSNSLHRA